METLEFLKEVQRMCKEYAYCKGCPIYGSCAFLGIKEKTPERLGDIVVTVEAWIETHPIKTNAQKFKEVFGFSMDDKFVLPAVVYDWLRKPYEEPYHDT